MLCVLVKNTLLIMRLSIDLINVLYLAAGISSAVFLHKFVKGARNLNDLEIGLVLTEIFLGFSLLLLSTILSVHKGDKIAVTPLVFVELSSRDGFRIF